MTDGPEAVNRFVPVRPACYHRPMKPLPALICLALMAACAPPPLYHKAGADPALAEARRTQCEVAALREVPRDIRTTYVPPRYMPAPFFDAHGHRWHGFVLLEPGRTESYDANAALRDRKRYFARQSRAAKDDGGAGRYAAQHVSRGERTCGWYGPTDRDG